MSLALAVAALWCSFKIFQWLTRVGQPAHDGTPHHTDRAVATPTTRRLDELARDDVQPEPSRGVEPPAPPVPPEPVGDPAPPEPVEAPALVEPQPTTAVASSAEQSRQIRTAALETTSRFAAVLQGAWVRWPGHDDVRVDRSRLFVTDGHLILIPDVGAEVALPLQMPFLHILDVSEGRQGAAVLFTPYQEALAEQADDPERVDPSSLAYDPDHAADFESRTGWKVSCYLGSRISLPRFMALSSEVRDEYIELSVQLQAQAQAQEQAAAELRATQEMLDRLESYGPARQVVPVASALATAGSASRPGSGTWVFEVASDRAHVGIFEDRVILAALDLDEDLVFSFDDPHLLIAAEEPDGATWSFKIRPLVRHMTDDLRLDTTSGDDPVTFLKRRYDWSILVDVDNPEIAERLTDLGSELVARSEPAWIADDPIGHRDDDEPQAVDPIEPLDWPVIDQPAEWAGGQPEPRLVRDALEAEHLASDWVRWMGWRDAAVTRFTGDGGIDVLGTEDGEPAVAAQVKFEAKPTGRPAVQNLYGASVGEGCTHHLFFSSAGYTREALDWADRVGVALFRFALDGTIEPVNNVADKLMEGAE